MNLYTHARKYIDVKDLRHLSKEKIKKRNIAEVQKQQEIILDELKKIEIETSPKFCNWRRELREGMTTGAMMSAALPPHDLGSYTTDMIVDQDLLNADSLIPVDGTATTDSDGGKTWTMNNSPDPGSAAVVAGFNADLSRMDTLSVSVHFTNATIDTNGADVVISGPPGSGLQQVISLSAPGSGSGSVNHNANPNITIDPALRVKGANVAFSFVGQTIDGTRQIGNNAVKITSCFPYRSQPMNVIVGLDDPEAVSFIRTDPTMQGLSAAQREKKLREMLDAGDEYLLKQLGLIGSSARPSETKQQQSFMDIRVGDKRITKKDGKTVNDTTRGIEDGMMDGEPFNPEPPQKEPPQKEPPKSPTSRRGYGLTAADIKKLAAADGHDYTISGDPNEIVYDMSDMLGRSNSQTKQAQQTISEPPNPTDNKAEIEKNIRDSLRQLEIDNEELKGERLRRNLAFAAQLGLDVLTVVTLLSPIPGDEALALSVQAGKAGVKTGAKTVAQRQTIDAFRREVTNPRTLTRAQDAIMRAGPKFSKNVAIPVKVQGKTIDVNASRILMRKGFRVNSYQPQGEVLSEKKKLKRVKDISKKIPGYYDGKPSPTGFPMDEPPKMVNGFHPDLIDGKKVADRFNKMDPISARSMPATGNPHIDKKVKAAAKKPK